MKTSTTNRRSALPNRPSIENLKKQAKDLLKAHKQRDVTVCGILKLLPNFVTASDRNILETGITLSQAQYALAMQYGCRSWKELRAKVLAKQHSENSTPENNPFISIVPDQVLNAVANEPSVLMIDIGQTTVNVGEVQQFGTEQVKLSRFATGKLKPGSDWESAVKTKLHNLIKNTGFQSRKCLVTLPGSKMFIRFIKISSEQVNLNATIQSELKRNIPFPISECVWDYHLHKNTFDDFSVMMLVVMKKQVYEELKNILLASELELIAVDLAPIACCNAFRCAKISDQNYSMLMSIEDDCTTLILEYRDNIFIRTIPPKGEKISSGILSDNTLVEIAGEVDRSLTVHREQVIKRDIKIKDLYLFGTCANSPEVRNYFENKFGFTIKTLDASSGIKLGSKIDKASLDANIHLLSLVIGLGCRYSMPDAVRLNIQRSKSII